MKIVALLPMKGNSERVPNKNLKNFNGKPLYHRIMNSLIESKFIDLIIVNTDSDLIISDIESNFISNKIKIHNRPKEIQGDLVSMNKIIQYDIQNSDGDIFIQTHSTNPILRNKTINRALEIFKLESLNSYKNFDSLFSVSRIQSRFYDHNKMPINHNPDELIRTQDLEPIFEENSCIYIFTKNSFFENNHKRIGKKPYLFEINNFESTDIDTMFDFKLAESIDNIINYE